MAKRYEHEDKCGGEFDCRMYECYNGEYIAGADYDELLKRIKELEALIKEIVESDYIFGFSELMSDRLKKVLKDEKE